MFGGVFEVAKELVGDVVEIATLGLIETKEAKRLAQAGLTIAEIALELDVTTAVIKKALDS